MFTTFYSSLPFVAFLSVLGYADPDVSSSRKESSHSKDRLSVVAPMQGSTAPSSLLRASARISSFDIGIPAPTVFSDRMVLNSILFLFDFVSNLVCVFCRYIFSPLVSLQFLMVVSVHGILFIVLGKC